MVREKFIFIQCRKHEYRTRDYICYYFTVAHLMGAYPHIAVLDPRSGEQLKLWSGYVPKPQDFLGELRDFLDQYSLNPRAKKPVGRPRGELRPMVPPPEAEQPWYIQSVEQPRSFFDDLYGVSDTEEPLHGKINTPTSGHALDPQNPTSQSPGANRSHFEGFPLSNSKHLPLHPFPSSSHARPARPARPVRPARPARSTRHADTITIIFCRLSGQAITSNTFSLSDPVRAMYEWLESRQIDTSSEGRGINLSYDGRDLSEGLNERIADIPGLVDSNSSEGVNIHVSINEGVLDGEKN